MFYDQIQKERGEKKTPKHYRLQPLCVQRVVHYTFFFQKWTKIMQRLSFFRFFKLPSISVTISKQPRRQCSSGDPYTAQETYNTHHITLSTKLPQMKYYHYNTSRKVSIIIRLTSEYGLAIHDIWQYILRHHIKAKADNVARLNVILCTTESSNVQSSLSRYQLV